MSKKESNPSPLLENKPPAPPPPPSIESIFPALDRADETIKKVFDDVENIKRKAQGLINRISDHFKDHHYFTKDDFESLLREEYLTEVRRNMPEDEGAPALDVDIDKDEK